MAIRYAKSAKSVEQLWQLISPLFPDLSCSGILFEIGFSALIYALDILVHIYARAFIYTYVYILKTLSIVSRSRGASVREKESTNALEILFHAEQLPSKQKNCLFICFVAATVAVDAVNNS